MDFRTSFNLAKSTILKETSTEPEEFKIKVEGYNWDNGIDYSKLLDAYNTTGFQATNFGKAIKEINKMIECRKNSIKKIDSNCKDEFITIKNNCTIFLGYTSNMVSSGLRETIKFLVKEKMIDCIVTTAGGIEEDIIKCLGDTYLGDFNKDDKKLRENGINRIGNLIVPNNNYRKFETWIMPILDKLLKEQKEKGLVWSPSTIIEQFGLAINNEESICYWAAKNKIPIFCPAITDGSIGDMLFFHAHEKKRALIVDLVKDIQRINTLTLMSINTGAIIIGGGLVKHHIMNSNSMRNGVNYSVYINTGSEFDGSDAGARPEEAITWGKINMQAQPVKIYAEATLVFPLLVAKTFAQHLLKNN